MPCGHRSRAMPCANPREANLALEKAILAPLTDEVAPVNIIDLFATSRSGESMSRAASREQSNAPYTPTRQACSKWARSKLIRLDPVDPPPLLALLTSTSTKPNSL